MSNRTSSTVGIDVSKAHLDAHELPSGRSARFRNNTVGLRELAAWIGPEPHRVVYESTGRWHRALEEALAESFPLSRVNATRARRFAQAMGQEAKTDTVDARVLAAMGAAVELRRVQAPSALQRDLVELHAARDALVRDRTAVLNRKQQARHRLVKRQTQYRLAQIERQIKALDAEITELIARDEKLSRRTVVLTSIPGVARITAATLLATMPELGGLDGKAAASLAGLAPVARDSGTWKGHRFIRGGRALPRRVLYMAAVSAITHNPDLASKYRQLRERGKPSKVALTAVMRKLLLLANTLLNQDREWRPAPAVAPG